MKGGGLSGQIRVGGKCVSAKASGRFYSCRIPFLDIVRCIMDKPRAAH